MGSPCGRLFAHGEPDGRVPSLHVGLFPQRCGDRAGRLPALHAGLFPGRSGENGGQIARAAGGAVPWSERGKWRADCPRCGRDCSLVGAGKIAGRLPALFRNCHVESPCGRLFAHGEPDGRVPSLHAGLFPQRCGDRAGGLPALRAELFSGRSGSGIMSLRQRKTGPRWRGPVLGKYHISRSACSQSQSMFFSVSGSKKCMTLPSKVMFRGAP